MYTSGKENRNYNQSTCQIWRFFRTPKSQKFLVTLQLKMKDSIVTNTTVYLMSTSTEQIFIQDFKYLARKLTYAIIEKESNRKGFENELLFNDSVRVKATEFVHSYMKKFGPQYRQVAINSSHFETA